MNNSDESKVDRHEVAATVAHRRKNLRRKYGVPAELIVSHPSATPWMTTSTPPRS
ncbi:hypothetical protein [Mumia zhuanghuii]|uniref:hypothetical protein n=1 Tax=Mumia zhuanghuii TaxID=2585211 RepID=UPI00129CDED3|nr:hypothetical protein [Mumia zhuanghuii]